MNAKVAMNSLRVLPPLLLLLLLCPRARAQEKLLQLLEGELKREMTELSTDEVPPYYISYRSCGESRVFISASFGTLDASEANRRRTLTTMVRVGGYDLDNFHEIRAAEDDFGAILDRAGAATALPLEDDEDAVRQVVWRDTDAAFRKAKDKLAKVKANVAVKVAEEDKSPDYARQEPCTYDEPPLRSADEVVDRAAWEGRMKRLSRLFLDDPDIFDGRATFGYTVQRNLFVSSEGGKVAQNRTAARVAVSGSVKSPDGMVMPLYKSYFAFEPSGLPNEQTMTADAAALVSILKKLKVAPIVDSYTGPAILSGAAAGVFFHEIFGHRIEGQRMKSESDSQTFKKKVGEAVLPEPISVIMDPTMRRFNGQDLNGFYHCDDEGMEGKRVTVVENGILKGFLMSRTPIDGFPESNGHGRAESGRQPVARQSNLIVEASKTLDAGALRARLIEEVLRQGLEYGYRFESVVGGFTMTGRFIPNAFNVTPVEVYRVYADGRPDELVRGVDLIGTPLAMFSQIEEVGNESEVFTGTCGAESGGVPVTAISPALFVKRIEMQRKVKSQERPPLLPRPDAEPGGADAD